MNESVLEKNQYDGQFIICDHCDLVVEVPRITNQYKASCPRCNSRLVRYRKKTNKQALVFAICALFMFIFSCLFYFIDIRILGNVTSIDIFMIPDTLLLDNYSSLSLVFISFVIFFPILCLLILIILCSGISLPKRITILLLVSLTRLQNWCMAEIFLAGTLVSFVKLASYGDIGLQHSFIPYCLFIIMQTQALSLFSPRQIWQTVAPTIQAETPFSSGKTGLSQNLRLCKCCHAILPMNKQICTRCYTKGYVREQQSLQWTMALVLTSLILYLPANGYPIMTTIFMGDISNSTIIDGVLYMWQDQDYPVALVIFFASVVIPISKIIALCWLGYFAKYAKQQDIKSCLKMNRLYKIVEFIGRWSMIDIFVVSIISTLVRNGELISVYPDIGAIFFATVVVMTMYASHKYDPRLIWDRLTHEEKGKGV
ncbi:PqiA/YebS family transporter subunit [Utexia brackfieldae]|uniref:PqiA/YebS family transporter subunit n=1 Tax=Utexia brackfieldae TaxID=3074108 RepID=UPI00370DAFA9